MNEEEAERVRAIFALFEQHRSLLLTLMEFERRGWRLKSWTRKTGQFRSGGPFALNSLRRLLTNVLYTGTIQHKGQPYPGEHEAILAPGTWERVQDLITQRTTVARGRTRNKHLALLVQSSTWRLLTHVVFKTLGRLRGPLLLSFANPRSAQWRATECG